jgi:hypothetical protein
VRLALTLALLVAAPSAGAEPRVRALRVDAAPVLDGRLDDAAWRAAPITDTFVQKFPREGAPPVERTTLRVVYDRDAIWFGFDCEQRVPIVARLTRRDRPVEADSVTITIDSRGAGTSAFEFAVNAAGVLFDAIRFNDTDSSSDWDENWDARVARTDHGWSAELRIPLRALRFDALPVQSWGLQARRYVSARQETDEWSFIPRDTAGEVSHYGKLDDLRRLRAASPFELRPFALARVRHRDPVSGTVGSGWDGGASAGLDLKWHLTQNLTLDATINPDFAQVEADQVILNLTTTEIFYPEKRPFFLEGIDAFSTPASILYTRRIGRAPDLPALPDGELPVDAPTPSTIWAAAKLVGTVGKRLTVAGLLALTGRNAIDAQQASGVRLPRFADATTLYDVLRLKLAVLRNTEIGALFTGTERFEPTGLYPIVPISNAGPTHALCPDGSWVGVNSRCMHDAYVAGVDGRWRSPSGAYTLFTQAVLSAIENGPPRQFLDGTIVNPGDLGGGAVLYFGKQGGRHWLFDLQYDVSSQKLDFNDLGYMQRQNQHHVYAGLEYRTTEAWGKTLESHWRVEWIERDSLAGLNLARMFQVWTQGKLKNFWGWWSEVHYRAPHFDDREVGDGTALERDGLVGFEIGVNSDARKRVYYEMFTQVQALFDGFNFYLDGKLTVRALPQLDFDLLPVLTYTFGEPRYAGAGAAPGETLWGNLTAGSVGATLRATYTFMPRLSLQVYAQLFLAFKHYDEYSIFRAGNQLGPVVHLADLRPTTQIPSTNPDLEEGVLNLNVVLRWEYRIGSTLFFVYTRAQSPDLTLMTGRAAQLDIGALRKAPAADVLLLKLSYWWG